MREERAAPANVQMDVGRGIALCARIDEDGAMTPFGPVSRRRQELYLYNVYYHAIVQLVGQLCCYVGRFR